MTVVQSVQSGYDFEKTYDSRVPPFSENKELRKEDFFMTIFFLFFFYFFFKDYNEASF